MNIKRVAIPLTNSAARSVVLLLIASAVCGGCKEQEVPAGSDVQVLDASKFRPAFANAPAEQQAVVDSVMTSIQASDLTKTGSAFENAGSN